VKEKKGKIIPFEQASHAHVHARKDEKLKKVQQGFKAVTEEKLKADRKQRRKRKNSKKKK
jgi:hypothetical protein